MSGLVATPLAIAYSKEFDWWRASRTKDSCEPPKSYNQFALSTLHDVNVFGCTYHKERVLYTATYVPDPQQTVKDSK